eukprot:TRINITY_DN739_c0_g1_i1.p1 TRINITY_DN739_c0_g1~~TRINITY_DN739_c0_g1_i1.p1  ORF type:complete len:492 (-),score=201.97 TRINITY_DN739_c0_g1_i1:50-1525(-)
MLDGRQIKISYAKQPTPNQNQIANANAALEQARWFSQVRQPNEQDTGGYIYDNNTGLYFDPNTQYYYDPKTQQYLYYDANTKAYVPFQQGAYETQNQSIYQENIAIDTTKTNEKKQQLNDKQIEDIKKNDSNSEANNTQNLENKSVQVTLEPTISTINIQPSKMNAFNNVKPAPNPVAKKKDMVKAPVKFSVNKKITIELNRWNQVSQELNNPEQSKEPQPIEIMPILSISTAQSNNIISDLTTNVNNPVISSTIGTSTVLTDQTISTKSSETVQQSTNVIEQKLSANICLLCKRQFDSAEKLAKHVELSDLHKKNLEIAKLKQQQAQKDNSLVGGNNNSGSSGNSGLGSGKHGWDFDFGKVSSSYAAKVSDGTTKISKSVGGRGSSDLPSLTGNDPGLSLTSNVGSKLLQKMGWKNGEGLGKHSTGINAPIEVEMRTERTGLGMQEPRGKEELILPGDSYQTAARKKMRQRYYQADEHEEIKIPAYHLKK